MRKYLSFFLLSAVASLNVFGVETNSVIFIIKKNLLITDRLVIGKVLSIDTIEDNKNVFSKIQLNVQENYSNSYINTPNNNLLNIYQLRGFKKSYFDNFQNLFVKGEKYYFLLNKENDKYILSSKAYSFIKINRNGNKYNYSVFNNGTPKIIDNYKIDLMLKNKLNKIFKYHDNIALHSAKSSARMPASIRPDQENTNNKVPVAVLLGFLVSLMVFYRKFVNH